jgi:hypothetical protein
MLRGCGAPEQAPMVMTAASAAAALKMKVRVRLGMAIACLAKGAGVKHLPGLGQENASGRFT